MATIEAQVQLLLAAPPALLQRARYDQLTAGLGLEVRLDAGDGKGKGLFAVKDFKEGDVLLREPPLAAIQHTANRLDAWVCSRCFRFIGSLEQQLARYIAALRCGAADEGGPGSGSECGDGNGSEDGSHVAAALALDAGAVEALASGQLSLPHAAAFPLPKPTSCLGGCTEESYCGEACAEAAWQQWHRLLCLGPDGGQSGDPGSSGTGDGTAGKGKAPLASRSCSHEHGGAAGAAAQELKGRRAALAEFLRLADDTNDVMRLAAVVVARVLLAAEQQLPQPGPGSGAGTSSGNEPSGEACWHALLAGWQPFASGHKALWWEVGSPPPEAAADMRHVAADALQLLVAALPPQLSSRYPALLQLPVWGSIIGMFELNNLDVVVGSPLQPWLELLEELPPQEQEAAYSVAGPFVDALPEELPCCAGNAFYALHSCCNHSCAPNAEAFKRREDVDGDAVIIALRDIAAGEEVLLSYIDEEAPLEERRQLLADYGFTCACDRCAADELAATLQLG